MWHITDKSHHVTRKNSSSINSYDYLLQYTNPVDSVCAPSPSLSMYLSLSLSIPPSLSLSLFHFSLSSTSSLVFSLSFSLWSNCMFAVYKVPTNTPHPLPPPFFFFFLGCFCCFCFVVVVVFVVVFLLLFFALAWFFFFFFFCVPGYISGIHHFGWDFCVCDHVLIQRLRYTVTFWLRGWCM